MKRVFIADDDEQAIRIMKWFVDRTPELEFAGSANDGQQVLDRIVKEKLAVDLLLLDVQMPGVDGIKIAEILKDEVHIVFVTAQEHYARQAFELHMADFLTKPVAYGRFLDMLERVKERDILKTAIARQFNQKITLSEGVKNQYRVYDVEDITYIMSSSNHIHIYFANRAPVKNRRQLHQIENQLPVELFMKTHRSYIVNVNKIERVEHDVIRLVNGGMAEVVKARRPELLWRVGKLPSC